MSSPLVYTEVFDQTADAVALDTGVMTVGGTARAITALLVVMMTVGAVGWAVTDVGQPSDGSPTPLVCVASVGALGLAIWAWLRPRRSAVLAPLYAAVQGLALGSLSHRYDAMSEGVVVQAIAGTMATLAAMILLYRCGAIRATDRVRARVLSAGAGLVLFWAVAAALRLGALEPSFLQHPGVAIIVSLTSASVAAFFLVLDFEVIESGVNGCAPRDMEWYAALGVVTTLVWIYLELLAIMSEDDD